MSLDAGDDVVVGDNEAVSAGSGLKLELYNAEEATLTLMPFYVVGQTSAPFTPEAPATQETANELNTPIRTMRLSILRGIASRANAWGGVIVNHIVANGKAVVGTSTSCGRTPSPIVTAGTPIQGPLLELELDIR
jgi:hypothetical protein